MATTMTNDLKNALLTALGVQLSGGALVLQTAGDVAVATLTLNSGSGNALNTPSSGSTTYKAITADTNAAGGVATKFIMRTSGGTTMYSGTVTASGGGGDLTLPTATIAVGGEVSVISITVSM